MQNAEKGTEFSFGFLSRRYLPWESSWVHANLGVIVLKTQGVPDANLRTARPQRCNISLISANWASLRWVSVEATAVDKRLRVTVIFRLFLLGVV
ncbi:hypothetical protein PoB_006523000 [Plakobranchus ocellatus]|uniref:Uncharacterized protein n=1 Tax=Plakobranchus ocellatus TaxID=259542 RepID=A0AAV4D3K8_9GAST|nr:hypothetical protein PoB_006523000 [Plakobranchus ocellatus]